MADLRCGMRSSPNAMTWGRTSLSQRCSTRSSQRFSREVRLSNGDWMSFTADVRCGMRTTPNAMTCGRTSLTRSCSASNAQ
eukprot:4004761-Amphidinium_carterae.1